MAQFAYPLPNVYPDTSQKMGYGGVVLSNHELADRSAPLHFARSQDEVVAM